MKNAGRRSNNGLRRRACLLLMSAVAACAAARAQPPFDLDTGNAPFEVVIPMGIPAILEDISPTASDVTLIFRVTTLVTNAWFDAIAPYHPTAVGVYTRFDERLSDPTNRNRNIAILYASRQVLNSLFPHRAAQWDAMLASVDLDPADDSTDPSTPVGVGNLAGLGVLDNRLHDGMNQMRVTTPYSYEDPGLFRAPFPWASQFWNFRAYRDQANEVLGVSANLTDEQKMMAELFDHKFNSVFSAVAFTVFSRGLSLDESVIVEFLTNMASFDTAIAIWNEKHRYDAVRPFSAIRFLYGNDHVTAWGGPGQGTVHDLPGTQWTSYLNVANHPEYPSASASFCAVHAQVMRRFLGSDALGFAVTLPAGSSTVEPGVTPATDLVLQWDTWTDLEHDCGQSRLWGGVHFSASIPAGMEIGHGIGDVAYEFVRRHVSGLAP